MASYRVSLVTCSSSRTVEKPCFSKERAFKIWSPRLAAAEERDQDIRLSECQNLTDGICACAGQDDVGCCKQMSQRRVYIFVLHISGAADETVIQMAFSADMYYLIFRQKFRKQCADGVVDGNSTQAPPMTIMMGLAAESPV